MKKPFNQPEDSLPASALAEIFLPTVILAGERPGGSPISQAFSVPASVMVPVAGMPALQRVMFAIEASEMARAGIICGPTTSIVGQSPALAGLLQDSAYEWLEQAHGPAASGLAAVKALNDYPALLTAGDHALLTPGIVDDFCRAALERQKQNQADFIIGLVPYPLVKAAFPASRRTILKFSDGYYCGSNLFAITSSDGLKALKFWQRAEADRKHPWRIAKRFGIVALLRYLARSLRSRDAMMALSKAAGCRIDFIPVQHARAAVDVDSVADQALAEQILLAEGERKEPGSKY
jgi:hypothetical protein